MKVEIVEDYNYFVDKEGRVYGNSGEEKAQFVDGYGYKRVALWKNNKYKFHLAHRLVAKALIPNPENKPCVNHKDGNKQNNHVNNLEWVTYSENTIHALEMGLKVPEQGEDVHNASITNETAHKVCQMMVDGYRNIEIRDILGVSMNVLSHIRAGKAWKGISDEYKIPKKSCTLSESTIRWICHQIESGIKNCDIVEMSNNPKVTKSVVTKIKNKKQFKEISKEFNF